jgi:hypothetical protein
VRVIKDPVAVKLIWALFAAWIFCERIIPPEIAVRLIELPATVVVVTVFPKLIAPPVVISISPPLVVTPPPPSPNCTVFASLR